jgi:DNA-binding CsgD family transcriptional regulator
MIATNNSSDAIHVLEALYDLEQPRASWSRGVLQAAAAAFDRGAGVGMVLYDISEGVPRVEAKNSINVDAEEGALLTAIHAEPAHAKHVVQVYRTAVCATLDEHVGDPALRKALREHSRAGVMDQILVNGGNHSGFGCALYVLSKEHLRLSGVERAQMSRIATHLSTAYRLLRRLETQPIAAEVGAVDAILKIDGRLEHAEMAASSREVRSSLTAAVKQREWARAGTRRSDPEQGTAAWKPLVVGRWSLVDRYERNGSRYIVARENAPTPKGPDALSPREGQVAALAGLGRSNKLIAYELGLAHSTVRVLLARAAAKLGARSRMELVEKLRRCHFA